MPKRVSIIVPLCDEEAGIPLLAEKLAKLGNRLSPKYEMELVMVDDGSRDNTRQMANRCFAQFARVVTLVHDRNRGLGAAIRTGLQHVSGDIVATIDADCTYDPMELLKLVAALEQTGADVAIGSPYHPEGQVVNAAAWRLLLSRGASYLYRRISGAQLYTFTSLMRVYRRTVVSDIAFASHSFVAVAEILLLATCQGFKCVEVPMILRPRATGVSKMKVVRTIIAHVGLMGRTLIRRALRSPILANRVRTKQDVVS